VVVLFKKSISMSFHDLPKASSIWKLGDILGCFYSPQKKKKLKKKKKKKKKDASQYNKVSLN
jgi:hypothetical protein